MKILIGSFMVLVFIVSLGTNVHAQLARGNVAIMTNHERAFP